MFLISPRHLTFLRTKTKAESHFYFGPRQAKYPEKEMVTLFCSALSCSKESEQQTALTKIKWRTKELFNPVVDFSPKRVEIVGGG